MASINSVLLLGNVGSVEVKEFDNGKSLVQISVATTSGYKKKDGEYENITEWHRCILAIPSMVERAKNIQVGDVIEVRGSIRTNKWTDKEGKDQFMKEISVTFYSTHKKAKAADGAPAPQGGGEAPQGGDDLPF
jgi:single-strand DNA-binding protein